MTDKYAPRNEDTVWIDVDVIEESDSGKAWLLSDSRIEAWVPKSQIIDSDGDLVEGRSNRIEIPTWLAEDKGFS